jgi:hypothetical protein
MDKHVNIISILWIIMGAIGIFGGLVAFGVLFGVSFIPDMEHEVPFILRTLAVGVGLIISVLAIPKIIAGIGLMKQREWARILTLILSFFSLLNFPLGTALAIYSFIILTKNETIELFRTK